MATMPNTMFYAASYLRVQPEAPRRYVSAVDTPATYRIAEEGLSRIFTATLLLVGGVEQAEAAMADAIGRMDAESISNLALLRECARAALAVPSGNDIEDASSLLPLELRRVLRLPLELRRSFVLRMLAGLSREECADLNVRDSDENVCAAIQELARIRQAEV